MRLLLLLCSALVLLGVSADEASSPYVTCGSAVKLLHAQTKFYLHSHEIAYGSGSGQQSVTGFPDSDDAGSLWTVKVDGCRQGDKVASGAALRFFHVSTGKWLHSHNHRSPLSQQQEVSAYGSAQQSDKGDVWRVESKSGAAYWERDSPVLLVHVETGAALSSSTKSYPRPIEGQHEVAGKQTRGGDCEWTAAEGVYYTPSA